MNPIHDKEYYEQAERRAAARAEWLALGHTLAKSTIICSYILAVLMPFAGFFAGIYLMCKKEHGHGLTVIALSLLLGGIFLWYVAGGSGDYTPVYQD